MFKQFSYHHLTLALLLAACLFGTVNSQGQATFDTLTVAPVTLGTQKIKFAVDSSQTVTAEKEVSVLKIDSAEADKKKKEKRHSPLKAALFSAALPGLGQGYNKKYWKIPIVYAGFAGLGYAIYYTATGFQGYRNAYRLQVDGNPDTYGSYKGVEDAATLKEYRDYFKRNLDISAICTAVWYTLNIVDAAVDAHLFEWNMSDDLSVSWRPVFINPTQGGNTAALGIGFRVNM